MGLGFLAAPHLDLGRAIVRCQTSLGFDGRRDLCFAPLPAGRQQAIGQPKDRLDPLIAAWLWSQQTQNRDAIRL